MSGIVLLAVRALMAAALYGFLFWALYTLWRDLKLHAISASTSQASPLTLISGEADHETRFSFEQPEVIVGRDPACDFYIDDATVSARHARLFFSHQQWWLDDLHSTNGTQLNGDPVLEPVVLTDGDQIRCGQVLFVINACKETK